ncbi:MAG: 3-hydroxyacyl-CoA dehydrogenase NAD-binding domain-containing protein [Rhodobacteraceae bacterium]|nr:3-hydroxyacyl-CoA dehydrogenase NAD-binding domain-containing protein [Paracoccaceae bacterium]
MVVSVTQHGDIAVVTICNPPVNATSQAVRQGLAEALDATERDPEVKAVVLACAGRTFIAGADITEFGKPAVAPNLPDLLTRIEAASKPWVAALHGTVLGGGLETALVCSHRIAAAATRLGLPEVTLGLIPGAGGTVRLPRLIPPERALEMIGTGKPVSAFEAKKIGLIDAIAEADVLEAALDLARHAAGVTKPDPLIKRAPQTSENEYEFDRVAAKIVARARGQIAPHQAVQSVRLALSIPADQALAAERAAFVTLQSDPQSRALRYLFFAERAATKNARTKGIATRGITHVAVIGGGTMGAGIAASCLLAGYGVTMIERDHLAAKSGAARVVNILKGSLSRSVISPERYDQLQDLFAVATSYADLAAADLVIEAVYEDLAVKLDVLRRLETHARPDAILASNTSYLDVNQIARAIDGSDRVIGLHFFAPAHIMKLLEIVVPDAVSDEALATGVQFARSLGKIPVLAGVCDGFIANRMMSAYRREADHMLEDGALPWEIDKAMVGFGLPVGVFQMQDLAGLDISWSMRKRLAATRDPAQRYVAIGDMLCEQGRFGRKTGRGYYLYDDQGEAQPDPEVEAMILAESRRKGIRRRAFAADAIMARIIGAMQSEGAAILSEGVAASPQDIDVVMANAFGFPRWRGGPMYMAVASE